MLTGCINFFQKIKHKKGVRMETSLPFCYSSSQGISLWWFSMSHWTFAVLLIFRHRIKCWVRFSFLPLQVRRENGNNKKQNPVLVKLLFWISQWHKEARKSLPEAWLAHGVACGLLCSCWFKHIRVIFGIFNVLVCNCVISEVPRGRVWISACKRSQ